MSGPATDYFTNSEGVNLEHGMKVVMARNSHHHGPEDGPVYMQIADKPTLIQVTDLNNNPTVIDLAAEGISNAQLPPGATIVKAEALIENEVQAPVNPLKRLQESIVFSALFGFSALHATVEPCHPKTRVEVQSIIMSWATNPYSKRFLWLSGPAASGKTAISMSIAEALSKQHLLGAGYFCSPHIRSSNLIPALAHQLIQDPRLGPLRHELLGSLEKNPNAVTDGIEVQFEKFFLDPLRRISEGYRNPEWRRLVLVIDGIDECPPEVSAGFHVPSIQKMVVNAFYAATEDPAFPFRVLMSGRPVVPVQSYLAKAGEGKALDIFLDEKFHPEADIEFYIRTKCAELLANFPEYPRDWPGEEKILTLVRKASGLFAYAVLAMWFITHGKRLPTAQLDCILGLPDVTTEEKPFAALDALYAKILSGEDGDAVLPAMWVAVIASEPLQSLPAQFVDRFLEPEGLGAVRIYPGLASLLRIPKSEDKTIPYKLYHQTVKDYLDDPNRCDPSFYTTPTQRKEYLLQRYLFVLKDHEARQGLWTNDQERDQFLDSFASTVPHFETWISELSSDKVYFKPEDYLACDVDWFMRVLFERLKGGAEAEATQAIYDNVHRDCQGLCTPACRHWRSAITRARREYSYEAPGNDCNCCTAL
ncbi:hypothetical protein DFP72DRAFT_178773 [Ephemerocybe angulata]|uniref:Nephrocystin 3-like N-terminal domain-containing protein n=1 Tax=Ephemerocybe angulata TaxID=980116 RepID=A0A8H6I686_9AGAR|nr:hypothetical protein DFP72DRAFT_178773 [Tulosesus angulatus]